MRVRSTARHQGRRSDAHSITHARSNSECLRRPQVHTRRPSCASRIKDALATLACMRPTGEISIVGFAHRPMIGLHKATRPDSHDPHWQWRSHRTKRRTDACSQRDRRTSHNNERQAPAHNSERHHDSASLATAAERLWNLNCSPLHADEVAALHSKWPSFICCMPFQMFDGSLRAGFGDNT